MPHVEIGIAVIERRIVWIGQTKVVVEGPFAEGRAEIVPGNRHCVVGSKLHTRVAEVVSIQWD